MKAERNYHQSGQNLVFTPIQDSHLQFENFHSETIEEGDVDKNASKKAAAKNI